MSTVPGERSILVTVCICTFNRSESLARTLGSLLRQERLDGVAWELLLVDNNSTDATREVADRFVPTLPLRYVFEPTQGLSAARNRALRESRGELLIFTDDDVVLEPGWLSAYVAAAREFPDAAYFGGRILPLWPDRKPKWLLDPSLALISGLLVYYDLGETNRIFAEADPLPFGANFGVRRLLVDALGSFNLGLGVTGDRPSRGEETEYLQRAVRLGHFGAYVGQAVCHHVQDSSRFKLFYLYRFGVESGKAARDFGKISGGSLMAEWLFIARGLVQLLKGRGDRFRQCVINAGIQRGLRAATSGPTVSTSNVRH